MQLKIEKEKCHSSVLQLMRTPLPTVLKETCWSFCIKHFRSQVLTLIFFKRGPNVWDSSMISAKHLLYIWSLWKFGPLWLAASREDSCCSWKKSYWQLLSSTILSGQFPKSRKLLPSITFFSNCLSFIHIKWSYGVIYLSIQFQMIKHRRYNKIMISLFTLANR